VPNTNAGWKSGGDARGDGGNPATVGGRQRERTRLGGGFRATLAPYAQERENKRAIERGKGGWGGTERGSWPKRTRSWAKTRQAWKNLGTSRVKNVESGNLRRGGLQGGW